MSKAQEKKRNQLKQARLEIVAGMYKRGYRPQKNSIRSREAA